MSAREIGSFDQGPSTLLRTTLARFEGDTRRPVYVQDLLDARVYCDKRGRLPHTDASDLDEHELNYGLDWELDSPRKEWSVSDLFPRKIRINVRCRYAVGDDVAIAPRVPLTAPPRHFRLSEWAVTHFNLPARELLARLER